MARGSIIFTRTVEILTAAATAALLSRSALNPLIRQGDFGSLASTATSLLSIAITTHVLRSGSTGTATLLTAAFAASPTPVQSTLVDRAIDRAVTRPLDKLVDRLQQAASRSLQHLPALAGLIETPIHLAETPRTVSATTRLTIETYASTATLATGTTPPDHTQPPTYSAPTADQPIPSQEDIVAIAKQSVAWMLLDTDPTPKPKSR